MALRMVEAFLAERSAALLGDLIEDEAVVGRWAEPLADGQVLVRLLIDVGQSEAILDHLEQQFSGEEGFRVLLLPVEASIPRPETAEQPESQTGGEKPEVQPPRIGRVSREELYEEKISRAQADMREVHLEREALGSEERQRTRRQLLLVERAHIVDAYHQGASSQQVYQRLIADVDAELLRLEAGEDLRDEERTTGEDGGPAERAARSDGDS
jgi:hypothetical protein